MKENLHDRTECFKNYVTENLPINAQGFYWDFEVSGSDYYGA